MLVVASGAHCAALLEEGDLYTWGGNDYGQLGNGGTGPEIVPALVMREVVSVAVGWNHTLVATKFGECFSWGCNGGGQLGDGTQIDRFSPVKVMDAVHAVAGGMCHSLALVRPPGRVITDCFGWGSSSASAVGEGASRITGLAQTACLPAQVCCNVRYITAGRNHSIAVLESGDCVTWGRNNYGQLGNGTTTHQLTPQKVLDRVREVTAGLDFTLAALDDGSCFAWGLNRNGQLGDGTTLDRLLPVKVLAGVRSVAAGHAHSLAILRSGACLGWGRNQCECVCSAEEAGSAIVGSDVLWPVPLLRSADAVAAGECQSIARSKNGDFSVWGQDWSGQVRSLASLGATAILRRPFNLQPPLMPEPPEPRTKEPEDEIRNRSDSPRMDKAVLTHCRSNVDDGNIDAIEEMDAFVKDHVHHVDVGSDVGSNAKSCDAEANDDNEPTAKETSVAETKKAVEDIVAEWKTASSREHGPRLHEQVHARARVAGRAYMLRWKRLLAERGDNSNSNAQGSNQDEAVLASFHAELWREAAQYRYDQKRPGGNGLDVAGWSQESRDFYTGVLAVDAVLRKATKAVIGNENLFAEPPSCLISSSASA